jgi:predicted kinase
VPLAVRDRLDRRIAAGRLRARHARALGRALAAWHAGAAQLPAAEGSAAPAELARRMQEAALAIAGDRRIAAPESAALLAAQRSFLTRGVDALLDRFVARRVQAIHGALGVRNLWLTEGKRVTLGPARAEATGDVAEDVAALTFALRARGAGQRAEQLAAAYALAADDYGIYRVLDFYERAAALALASAGGRAAATDGAAAVRAVLARPRRALVVAVGGAVASGKSTVAKAIARRLGAPRVVADRVRDALLESGRANGVHEALWARSFAPEFSERVYAGMLRRAADVLASGRPVVLDACFPTAQLRIGVTTEAERHGVPCVFVHCDPERASIEARLRKRDARDGAAGDWQALAAELAARWEPPGAGWLRIDTGVPNAARSAEIDAACSRWREIARDVKD